MDKKIKIIAISGPTATGKTREAVQLARKFDGEIISLDSRQVYRHMDIGTGKDLSEYGEIPYHLIDLADPDQIYDLARFCGDVKKAIRDIAGRKKLPILAGGTPLYLDAVLNRYLLPGGGAQTELRAQLDEMSVEELASNLRRTYPEAWNHLNDDDRVNHLRLRRAMELSSGIGGKTAAEESWPEFEMLTLGVYYPRSEVRARIAVRLDSRFESGMIDEVSLLHDQYGVSWEKLERFGLEYREISLFLQNQCTEAEMRQRLLEKIRQFAKRQDIFFRKIERANHPIYWYTPPASPDFLVKNFLDHIPLPPPALRLCDIENPKRITPVTR